jgi:hypothetical protein
MNESNIVSFPYDPAYGLPDSQRYKAVLTSIKYGVAKAADIHNVSVASIYKWRRDLGLNNKAVKRLGDKCDTSSNTSTT